MAELDLLIKAWDEFSWEFTLVFEGLEDADVWRRPHPRLLSIGELAGHVAYYEAVRFTGPGPTDKPDLADVRIKSPLLHAGLSYYSGNVDVPVDLGLSTADTLAEFKRIHEESKSALTSVDRGVNDIVPGYKDAKYGDVLQYMLFHVSYHAGQAYSVRHLFGHTPTDN